MSKNNRICKACGQSYYFCPTCGTNKPSWYKLYDSEECKDAYMALSDFSFGHIDANRANEILNEKNVVFADEDLVAIAEEIKKAAKKTKKFNLNDEYIVKDNY